MTDTRPDAPTRPEVVLLDGTHDWDRESLGGKAYSVHRMRQLGLPVPPAFALPTWMCQRYHDAGGRLPEEVWAQVRDAVAVLEEQTGRTFGAGPHPLLVSVRSGAAQSMPGMMDTVLNLGLTEELVPVLGGASEQAWAADTWARFRRSYAETVRGEELTEGEVPAPPPADPWEQLRAAVGAVFDSWTNERVRAYRERHGLGAGTGTAVTVQAMVFGNRDDRSGTGVMFSRDPGTGEPVLYGEWLRNAQGEDVVSGGATPLPLTAVRALSPDAYDRLEELARGLEREHRDLVDIEFTIESDTLYLLQCRAGKRSPRAAVRIAADLVAEGLLTAEEALGRVGAEQVEALAADRSVVAGATVVARGLGACPGVVTGVAATDLDEVLSLLDAGRTPVLVRTFTAPDDVPAMFQSVGVVTEVGGATSHAALVCREIAMPCVVGAGEGVVAALAGRTITVDGGAGVVYDGEVQIDAAAPLDPAVAALAAVATAAGLDHPILGLVAAGA